MDHYVILIFRDEPSPEERDLLCNIIRRLLPCDKEKNYCRTFAVQISSLLAKDHINLAIIAANKCQSQTTVSWHQNKVDKESILTCLNSSTSENGAPENSFSDSILSQEEASYYCHTLHKLADQLPSDGTYYLDIIINSNVFIGLEVRHCMDFAGALYRMRVWHDGNISIVSKNLSDDSIQSWCEAIDAHVVDKGNTFSEGTFFWRGGIQIGLPDTLGCKYLHNFQLELQNRKDAEVWSHAIETTNVDSTSGNHKDFLIVSPKLDVLDECELESIPHHIIAPIAFHVTISQSHQMNNESNEFLQLVKEKSHTGLIVRLEYSQDILPPQNNPKTTEKWKDAVITGDISTSDPILPYPKKHLTFLLTGAGSNGPYMVVYLLRDPRHLKVDFHHRILTSQLPFIAAEVSESCKNKAAIIFKGIPHLHSYMCDYTKAMKDTQLYVLQKWQDQNGQADVNEIKLIMQQVQNIVHSKFKQNMMSQNLAPCLDSGVDLNEPLDPSNWAERIFLRQRQILADKNKQFSSSDTLGGLTPPVPNKKTVVVSAKDINSYFTTSGEAKNEPSVVIRFSTKSKMKDKINIWHNPVEEVLSLKWPEAQRIKCHDTYYNHSNYCEDLEAKCSRIIGRCLIDETASTCNHHRRSTSFAVLRSQVDITAKENCLPEHLATQRDRRARKRKSSTDQKFLHKHSHASNKKQCLVSRTNSSSSLEGQREIFQPLHRNNYKHFDSEKDMTLRRSPRKLIRVNYKQSPSRMKNRKPEVKVQVPSDDLSENHKKKLRDAVAAALEQHGISLEHPAFKPCGRKLFAVCKAFVKDVIGKGSTSSQMKKIAQAHAKQVIEFEMQKKS